MLEYYFKAGILSPKVNTRISLQKLKNEKIQRCLPKDMYLVERKFLISGYNWEYQENGGLCKISYRKYVLTFM